MLHDVQLPFFPTATNCLAWSHDGELAVAAGEFVHILVPNRRLKNRKNENNSSDPWTHVRVRVNTFGFDEWEHQEPASFHDLSIGEEQSPSLVRALAWSPPGLAKHRHCVLAVLTTNLVLSLWQSASDTKRSSYWKRVLIVNHAVQTFLSQPAGSPSRQTGVEHPVQQRTRARAFAWSQPISLPQDEVGTLSESKWGFHLLAIANDLSEVFFIQVRSPHALYDIDDGDWTLDVLAHRGTPEFQVEDMSGISSLAATFKKRQSPGDLAWSPWRIGGGSIRATFTSKANDTRRSISVVVRLVNMSCRYLAIEFEGTGNDKELHDQDGPTVYWENSYHDQHVLATASHQIVRLAVWPSNETHELQLRSKPDRWLGQASEDLSSATLRPWDQVSSLTFGDGSIPNHGFLYTTTHLSTLQIMKFSPIAIPEASYHHTISSLCAGYSHLQARLSDCAKQFSNEHSLGDMTTTKTWGLATHGQYVAACITLHPSEMIEYITPAHERATIVFSHSDLEDLPDADLEKEQQLCFPWEQPQQLRPASSVHAEKLDLILSTQSSSIFNPAISNIDARILYIAACSSTLLWTPQRSSLLAKARDSLIALQLHLDAVDFRPELDLLFNLTTSADNNPSSSPSDVLAQLDQAIYSRRTEEILAPLFETCAIPGCGALLGWANFSTARCKAGHLWNRCATTLLAIQNPYLSKFCDVCNRESLNDQVDEVAVELGTSVVARMLLGFFDTCAFCGGKFVG